LSSMNTCPQSDGIKALRAAGESMI
jgi:hypothetical protein